ncbi:uncharacterized protein METZ01_LOCUS285826, partial [marine metagenome]
MKFLPTALFTLTNGKSSGRRNVRQLISLVLIVLVFILISSVVFHWIAAHENMVSDNNNNEIKWYDGFYWTMVTMSTLGYGDITFSSPLGKFYSLGVMLFGMLSMFIILPFAFIRFAYEPWMEAQNAARTPRTLPEDTRGHVIITNFDPVSRALIHKLEQYANPYVLLVGDKDEALRLHDQGVVVAVGDLDDPEAFRNVRVEQ